MCIYLFVLFLLLFIQFDCSLQLIPNKIFFVLVAQGAGTGTSAGGGIGMFAGTATWCATYELRPWYNSSTGTGSNIRVFKLGEMELKYRDFLKY